MSVKNPHAVALGRLGGLAGKGQSSPKKAAAARINGRKGGRPKKVKPRQDAQTVAVEGDVRLIVAKNRTGPTGGVDLRWIPSQTRFASQGGS
jgi:replicative DNA helicase